MASHRFPFSIRRFRFSVLDLFVWTSAVGIGLAIGLQGAPWLVRSLLLAMIFAFCCRKSARFAGDVYGEHAYRIPASSAITAAVVGSTLLLLICVVVFLMVLRIAGWV